MARLSFQVRGLKELEDRLRQMGENAPTVAAQALTRWAEEIMAKAKALVPVDTGQLRATGHVNPPQFAGMDVTVQLVFGGPAAPYALAVHENPRSGKTGGVSPQGKRYAHWATVGQWKYLETPLKESIPPAALTVLRDGLT